MTKGPLNALTKRDLLAAQKFDPDEVRQAAEAFFEDKLYSDALEFYAKLQDAAGLDRIKRVAIEMGNPELMWRLANYARDRVTKQDWSACGCTASNASGPIPLMRQISKPASAVPGHPTAAPGSTAALASREPAAAMPSA